MPYVHHYTYTALQAADGLSAAVARVNAAAATRPWLSGVALAPVSWARAESAQPSQWPHAVLVPNFDQPAGDEEWDYSLIFSVEDRAEDGNNDALVGRVLDYGAIIRDWAETVETIGEIGSLVRPYQGSRWAEVFEPEGYLYAGYQAVILIRVVEPSSFFH